MKRAAVTLLLFGVATCFTLLLVIELWQPHPLALFRVTAVAGAVVRAAFMRPLPMPRRR